MALHPAVLKERRLLDVPLSGLKFLRPAVARPATPDPTSVSRCALTKHIVPSDVTIPLLSRGPYYQVEGVGYRQLERPFLLRYQHLRRSMSTVNLNETS